MSSLHIVYALPQRTAISHCVRSTPVNSYWVKYRHNLRGQIYSWMRFRILRFCYIVRTLHTFQSSLVSDWTPNEFQLKETGKLVFFKTYMFLLPVSPEDEKPAPALSRLKFYCRLIISTYTCVALCSLTQCETLYAR